MVDSKKRRVTEGLVEEIEKGDGLEVGPRVMDLVDPKNVITAGSTLSWNCRGLGNPRTVQALKGLVMDLKPNFIFLMETLLIRPKLEYLQKQRGYEGMFVIDCRGRSGGLALLWKERGWVKLLKYSRNFIDVQVTNQSWATWRLTGFYGARRKESWELLRMLAASSNLLWCCIGDFNDILHQSEKSGLRKQPEWLIKGFHSAIVDAELMDMGWVGSPFT